MPEAGPKSVIAPVIPESILGRIDDTPLRVLAGSAASIIGVAAILAGPMEAFAAKPNVRKMAADSTAKVICNSLGFSKKGNLVTPIADCNVGGEPIAPSEINVTIPVATKIDAKGIACLPESKTKIVTLDPKMAREKISAIFSVGANQNHGALKPAKIEQTFELMGDQSNRNCAVLDVNAKGLTPDQARGAGIAILEPEINARYSGEIDTDCQYIIGTTIDPDTGRVDAGSIACTQEISGNGNPGCQDGADSPKVFTRLFGRTEKSPIPVIGVICNKLPVGGNGVTGLIIKTAKEVCNIKLDMRPKSVYLPAGDYDVTAYSTFGFTRGDAHNTQTLMSESQTTHISSGPDQNVCDSMPTPDANGVSLVHVPYYRG